MRTSDLVASAGKALRANPMRSALTALGVIIGVASVVAMVALGSAAFRIASWNEAPWRARWTHGGTPMLLEVSAADRVLRFLTPDADLAIERLRDALPGAATPPPAAR